MGVIIGSTLTVETSSIMIFVSGIGWDDEIELRSEDLRHGYTYRWQLRRSELKLDVLGSNMSKLVILQHTRHSARVMDDIMLFEGDNEGSTLDEAVEEAINDWQLLLLGGHNANDLDKCFLYDDIGIEDVEELEWRNLLILWEIDKFSISFGNCTTGSISWYSIE